MNNSRQRPLSLTLRVVLFVTLTISICLFFVRQMLISSVEHHFIQQDADELAVIVRSVEEILHRAATQQQLSATSLSLAVAGHHGVFYQIMDEHNALIYRNADFDLTQLSSLSVAADHFDDAQIFNWRLAEKTYRGVVVKLTSAAANYQVIAAIDTSFHLQFLQQLQRSLGFILFGSCILTLLAAWLAVHQGLGPLRGLTEQMRDIQTNKLDIRLNPNTVPAELEHMVQSFNHMLHRLEEGFTKLSHFSADIAHELRTPLTNIITQTQVSLSKPRTLQEYQNVLFSNLEEQERLNKMISDMLWLAKSQNGLITLQKQPLNLADEINAIFDFFEALAEESGVKLQFSGAAIMVQADRTLLRHALTNLLSNALRYTAKGQSITVTTALAAPDSVTICVENPGLPIPPKHLPFLFERFYRADQSRQRHSEGAGLGLAITKAIVEAHEGHIAVESDQQSTRFMVRLKTA
ncbi:heavy metal sensor histidine kinase [Arsukibacterium sp.]|uniref:heavy metal sensor histidine kinase n=1 Tax=Arsukibacterium sp. TaxID=1977258 RepID=UPI00299E5B77|nr:heavy metal sensor histidine kinase [Arsukibacterium sp.]MDX1537246.1 heavy metal sensor histidine kinase [Arsukibacterium sp.]